ncbi:TonB-dependent hemoglobin/transferrin/lactoferrin family receptor [Yersinia bercovieri]|uniref:TonB-dependent hemoglobin/transferrin/lactoferrin family receptor n=1 Tax=Yersinia bercovieri TaxID=634 RepID=UPI0005E20927|nr:TonB-dependent hemoglobin/transferrin/lactoferrin family receptor [Yersinia bercovieri]MDN0104895.1 TonB-dependent hemoglobin/transferrin/lactoferrin family receptor [Yersinia bercovieri]CNJ01125.1 putative TonB dependent receptor protein [Yersinia bercovieri]
MDNIVLQRKTTISPMSKISLGIFLALTAQGYSESAKSETIKAEATQAAAAEASSGKSEMVLDKLKVEEVSNAHEGDWVYDEARSVSEISREQMDNRPARHAADILEQTPGVYSSLSQQDPGLSVNIRGMQDYGRVNMNIDGMRQNFMKSSHGQRNGVMYIDPEILNNVTIEKGVSSGIGGAGVIGGIATFNTINASDFIEPGKEIGGKVRATTGDNGTQFIGSAMLALGNEYGDLLISASERNLKDYWPGNKGDISEVRMGNHTKKFDNDLKNNKVDFTYYKLHSRLAKLGWNLSADQRLVLSYLQTQVESPNVGMFTQVDIDRSTPVHSFKYGWLSGSITDVMNTNIGLDYSLKPEHIGWLDVMAKIYYVDTDDKTDTHNSDAVFRKAYWTQTRLSTKGLQLQNTSLFTPADQHQLRIKYGLEWFSDRSRGYTTNNYQQERSLSEEIVNRLTPPGKRAITSTFAQINYDYDDWLRLEGGLRYDQFRLQGDTWLYTYAFRQPYTIDNPCDPKLHEQSEERPRCSSRRVTRMDWDVDRRERQLSPTAAFGIKPGVPWLEFFGTYGKSWRPPAMTEMLAIGSAHGHGWILPNPLLAAEHSKTWELGVNIQQTGLFITEDRFAAKVAYFDSRVSNYTSMVQARTKPMSGGATFANVTYINNLSQTKFRGLEYQLSYDAGLFYTNIAYTRMIGINEFCAKEAWLGGVKSTKRIKKANYGKAYYWIDNEFMNNKVGCHAASQLFSSSAYLPGDRGSLTLGGRIFDQKLDLGTIIRYNKGHQDKSVLNNTGYPTVAYVADWRKYTIFDLYASYQVTNNLVLRTSIENVTNRAYLISYGDTLSFAPNRGRTIQGGFEYRF